MTNWQRREVKPRIASGGSSVGVRQTRFMAIADEGRGGTNYHALAHVDLTHEQEMPNFRNRGSDVESVNSDAPTELFRNRPAEITGAFTHPDMRAHMPTLLGIAADQHQRMTGRATLPMAAKSLSADSANMISKLRSKGVSVPLHPANPSGQQTNTIDKTDMDIHVVHAADDLGTVMPASDVRSGRDLVRGMLRSHVNPRQFG